MWIEHKKFWYCMVKYFIFFWNIPYVQLSNHLNTRNKFKLINFAVQGLVWNFHQLYKMVKWYHLVYVRKWHSIFQSTCSIQHRCSYRDPESFLRNNCDIFYLPCLCLLLLKQFSKYQKLHNFLLKVWVKDVFR